MPSFDYKEEESGIFGKILRPLIELEAYSKSENAWVRLRNVLADTGADISMVPRDIGELLVEDITKGKLVEIKGIVPYSKLICYIHQVRLKIGGKEFELPVAVSESNDAPLILGRAEGLDRFSASFTSGKRVTIE